MHLFVFPKPLIDKGIHFIEVSKGRHGPRLAPGIRPEIPLQLQSKLGAARVFEKIEIYITKPATLHGQFIVQLNDYVLANSSRECALIQPPPAL